MNPTPYQSMSELDLRSLCIWREARGEGDLGKRGVGWVIQNRADNPGWWGKTPVGVILCPFQFSSFNQSDPQYDLWPNDDSRSWFDCQQVAAAIMNGTDDDITDGANYYHDTSMGWPKSWGDESNYAHTLDVGNLRFYRYLGQIKTI
jgi:N-acetylmuramoyl-L-alanine amidase